MPQNNLSPNLYQGIDWDNVKGPLPVCMTNDYLFRALLQKNNKVLKSLVCSLMHLAPDDVTSIKIANPIELGESVKQKEFILDIQLELNHNTTVNLEMQVVNEGNWPERSLCYLCRSFASINTGEGYEDIKPAVQIGILNFTLFKNEPEFYATYHMLNKRTHRPYSDKLRLSVLNLKQLELATEEDRQYGIDRWAKLFNATTWEELKMLANSDPDMQDAVVTVCQLTMEQKIRQQCEAREDYYRRTVGRERRLREALAENERLAAERKQDAINLNQAIAEKELTAINLNQAIAEKELAVSKMEQAVSEKELAVSKYEKLLQKLNELGIDIDIENDI